MTPLKHDQQQAEASEHYNKIDPSFAPVTPDEVEQCANYWSGNMRFVMCSSSFPQSPVTHVVYHCFIHSRRWMCVMKALLV